MTHDLHVPTVELTPPGAAAAEHGRDRRGRRPSTLSRAKALVGGVLLIGLSGLAPACAADVGEASAAEAAPATTATPEGSQLHDLYVVAHEDDDLLFMSPDLRSSILDGHTVRTIYLTAGDAGETSVYWKDGREAGIRAAYARMAGVADSWTGSEDPVNGKTAYRFTLDGNPQVSVVFLRLPDGCFGDGCGTPASDPLDCSGRPGNTSLQSLWRDLTGTYTVPVLGTWRSSKGLCSGVTYTRRELQAVLSSLVQSFAPARLHIQDLSHLHGHDHSDHVHGAKFAFNAHHAYALDHQLFVHRGYNINSEEENLTAAQKSTKGDVFCTYAVHDSHIAAGDCRAYGAGSPGSWLGSEYVSAQVEGVSGWLGGLADKCLDLPDGNTTDGTPLQIRDCADVPGQKWALSSSKLELAGTTKCVDLPGGNAANGTPLQIRDCADVPGQKWTLTSDGALRGLDGQCVDVRGAGTANGTAVQLWDCTAETVGASQQGIVPRQRWTLLFDGVSGYLHYPTGTSAASAQPAARTSRPSM